MTTQAERMAASAELHQRIAAVMKKEPSLSSTQMGKRVGCAQTTANTHMRAIRAEQDNVDDNEHQEEPVAAKKNDSEGGGSRSERKREAPRLVRAAREGAARAHRDLELAACEEHREDRRPRSSRDGRGVAA